MRMLASTLFGLMSAVFVAYTFAPPIAAALAHAGALIATTH